MRLLKNKIEVNITPGPSGIMIREEYTDGTCAWLNTLGYENTKDAKKYEQEYQKLINKPVQTTKEQPLPTTDQIIKWIVEHHKLAQNDKFHFCPCLLGKPFYPDNDCQCGG